MPDIRAWLAWGSGKDAAYALHVLREEERADVVGLLSTLDEQSGKVAMHGTPRALLRAQAAALGLPLVEVALPSPASNAVYEERMAAALGRARELGVAACAFGDLFLEDIRAYRERQLEGSGVAPLFPLWGRDTRELAHAMLDAGIEATITCVDSEALDASFCGRRFDAALLDALPEGVDPCGERGEFHTFVSWAPGFARRVGARVEEVVDEGRFVRARIVGVAGD